jgi:hypothetical protein
MNKNIRKKNNNCWGWIKGSRGATTITKDEQKDYEEQQQ